MSKSILEIALSKVRGKREEDYGDTLTDFTRIARLWEVILGCPVTPLQVALCMIQVKISRLTNKFKRDSLIDIAGFAECADAVMSSPSSTDTSGSLKKALETVASKTEGNELEIKTPTGTLLLKLDDSGDEIVSWEITPFK